MNYKEEPYPLDLNQLMKNACDIAAISLEKLNMSDCPELNSLNMEFHKTCGAKPEFSVRQNKIALDSLGYTANVKSGKSKPKNEFMGLYIFGEDANGKVEPVYVGISRVTFKRLRNHGWGKTTATCTLAYLMAKNENKNLKRDVIENSVHLEPQKEKIRNLKVVLVSVKEDYNLYFLEVALAGILKTKWNSFKTH